MNVIASRMQNPPGVIESAGWSVNAIAGGYRATPRESKWLNATRALGARMPGPYRVQVAGQCGSHVLHRWIPPRAIPIDSRQQNGSQNSIDAGVGLDPC